MQKNEKKINRIVLINILSTVALNGITFLTAPLFSRMLGAENYGISSVYISWVSIFSACLSLQTSSTLFIAKTQFPEEEQSRYHSSIITLSLLSFAISAVVMILLRSTLEKLLQMEFAMILLMLVQAYGLFCVGVRNAVNTIDFHAEKNLVLSGAVSLTSVGLSILLINYFPKENNYWGRILALAAVYGVFGILITAQYFKEGKTFYSREYWRFCLPLSIPIIFHSIANLVLGQSDRVMLQQMVSTSSAGIYSLAAGFASVMATIWSSLNNSWSPFFYEFAKNGESSQIKIHGKNYLELYTVLTVGFMLLTPEVFHVFAAEEYWSGTVIIPILVVGSYFIFLYSFPVNYEFFCCQTKTTATCTVLAAVCNIILNWLLIPRYGFLGAALATMLAHGLQYMFHHLNARKLKSSIEYPFSIKMILPYTVVVLLIAIAMVLVPVHWAIRWLLGAVLGVFELLRIAKRKRIF